MPICEVLFSHQNLQEFCFLIQGLICAFNLLLLHQIELTNSVLLYFSVLPLFYTLPLQSISDQLGNCPFYARQKDMMVICTFSGFCFAARTKPF